MDVLGSPRFLVKGVKADERPIYMCSQRGSDDEGHCD